MTVKDLLTMSQGYECTHNPPDATTNEMMATPDWVQFAIDQPMTDVPGTRWVYCSPSPHLLSAVLTESMGMSTEAFARHRIFSPLGVSNASWSTDSEGNNRGWGDLFLAPYDMAKIGYLQLQEGE